MAYTATPPPRGSTPLGLVTVQPYSTPFHAISITYTPCTGIGNGAFWRGGLCELHCYGTIFHKTSVYQAINLYTVDTNKKLRVLHLTTHYSMEECASCSCTSSYKTGNHTHNDVMVACRYAGYILKALCHTIMADYLLIEAARAHAVNEQWAWLRIERFTCTFKAAR